MHADYGLEHAALWLLPSLVIKSLNYATGLQCYITKMMHVSGYKYIYIYTNKKMRDLKWFVEKFCCLQKSIQRELLTTDVYTGESIACCFSAKISSQED